MSEKKQFGSSFRSALSWNMLNIGVGQVMTLGIFLLLTTRLSPAVFGIFALALVFIEFFNLEGRHSIIDTIVQRQRFDKRSLSTVFWVALGIFGAFSALFVLLAPVIANAFGQSEITDVLRALAVTLLFIPLSFAPTAVLWERHDFKSITLRLIFAKFAGGIAALIVAFGPAPEWALVAQARRLQYSRGRPAHDPDQDHPVISF